MSLRFTVVWGFPLAAVLQFAPSSQTDREPVPVDLCRVVGLPDRYNEKALSVEGILSPGEHSLTLYSPACKPKDGFDVSIQAVLPPNWESLPNGKHLRKILRSRKDARVTLNGKFQSGNGRYGPDAAQFRFSISQVLSVGNAPKIASEALD